MSVCLTLICFVCLDPSLKSSPSTFHSLISVSHSCLALSLEIFKIEVLPYCYENYQTQRKMKELYSK